MIALLRTSLLRAVVAGLLGLCAAHADELGDAKSKLASSDGRERRSAVSELARIATPEAWKLVLGALADPDPQVADEAQLRIAQIESPAARKMLFEKDGAASRDALVRERVVESLGRWSSRPPTEALANPLDDREVAVRRTAAWTIERLARAGRFAGAWETELVEMSALEAALSSQAAREKDAETHAALVTAHQALFGAPRRKDVEALVAHKSAPARAAAMLALVGADGAEALSHARKLSSDPALGVRLACAKLLHSIATKAAVSELVEMLERETAARARWRYVGFLRELSGLRHRTDARPWRDWIAKQPDGLLPAVEGKSESSDDGVSAAFAGLPILSDRVAFLIDLSGSMWEKRADGRTRKEIVDEQLARALKALDPSVQFNVVVYTARPAAWKERLTAATPKAVDDALQFFAKRTDRGKGDFWGALEFTLQDPEIDTVIVLSDGAPSGGRRWNMELIVPLFAERARFRGVALDAVLADASKRLREHWVRMCEDSGGRVVDIRLQ